MAEGARWGRRLPSRQALLAGGAITNVDQETGEKGKEPLRTLASYRKVGDKVFFGQNAIPDGSGRLCVSDAVEVVS